MGAECSLPRSQPANRPCSQSDKSNPRVPHFICARKFLILSYYLRQCLPSGLAPSGSFTNTPRATCPTYLTLFHFITLYTQDFGWGVHSKQLLRMQSFPFSCIFLPLSGPNTVLSTLFSKIFSPYSSPNFSSVCFNLQATFLYSKRDHKTLMERRASLKCNQLLVGSKIQFRFVTAVTKSLK
jgi:hypothetical protein